MRITQEQLDTPIAELEGYGLSVMMMCFLERRFGALYVRDLLSITSKDVLSETGLGRRRLEELQKSLRRFFDRTKRKELKCEKQLESLDRVS